MNATRLPPQETAQVFGVALLMSALRLSMSR